MILPETTTPEALAERRVTLKQVAELFFGDARHVSTLRVEIDRPHRVKHGATSPIGCRCSNIVELIQMPEVPKFQIERQMADLQRLLNDDQ